MDDDLEDDEEFELQMRFVVCQSEGGALDDKAFVAGCNFARHHLSLLACSGADQWSEWVIPEMVPQYDLLAMDLGYVMTSETCGEDTEGCWVRVVFRRPEEDNG